MMSGGSRRRKLTPNLLRSCGSLGPGPSLPVGLIITRTPGEANHARAPAAAGPLSEPGHARSYAAYFNEMRTHRSPDKDATGASPNSAHWQPPVTPHF